MANYNLVADVSSWQKSDMNFFEYLKNQGVKAVIVKLTEGTYYKNPKAQEQINNALKCGMRVHGYHYAKFSNENEAVAEADYFTAHANELGLTNKSFMCLDYEDGATASSNSTADANAFLNRVVADGYGLVNVYSMASWFWNNKLDVNKLATSNLWVANYGVDAPGVDNVGLWQFTNKYGGKSLDMSYDFFGAYTDGEPTPVQATETVSSGNVWTDDLGDVWHAENGNFKLSEAINLRWGAKTDSSLIATLNPGDVVKYDAYSIHNGYVWIRQPRDGGYAYLATGHAANGKRSDYWGTFY